MQDDPDPIRPTDLAGKLNISVAYASQLLSGARKPSLELALRFFDLADVRLGPLVGASDEEIATLRKLAA
jgi:transcriptional regulator with XRE-family HTH domain